MALRLAPFCLFRRLLDDRKEDPDCPPRLNRATVEQVVWAVDVASAQFPSVATCLTRSLVAKALCVLSGSPVKLRIGIAHSAEGRFEAHSWIEGDGKILVGGQSDILRYVALPVVRRPRR